MRCNIVRPGDVSLVVPDGASAAVQILQQLYDEDFVVEESFLEWAEEKRNSEEDEKRFLHMAQPFIDWLQNADEESDEEDGQDSE